MGERKRDEIGVWNGTTPLGNDWVFMGVFRCESCGRSVTIVNSTREERALFHRRKRCPGGCATVR